MIHFFNPGHETAVLNSSKYHMAPANVVSMQKELSFLPAWYANIEDFVLIDNNLSEEFISGITNFLDILPGTITQNDFLLHKNKFVSQIICFWGITPQAIYLFDTINSKYQLNLNIPTWKEEYKLLNSRYIAKECLEFIIDKNNAFTPEIVPVFFHSLNNIKEYIEQNKDTQYLAKAPYSSSGRGLLWLPKGKLSCTELQILHGHLKKQESVSIEKALSKKLDFAMEFTTKEQIVTFEGLSLFKTNTKGAYLGNILCSQQQIENEILQFIPLHLLKETKEALIQFIKKQIAPVYDGCIGVDMLVYEENSRFLLQPCIEINLRNNMGLLAIKLFENIIVENSSGFFNIDFSSTPGAIYNKHNEMKKQHPALIENKKIKSGYLSLCPVNRHNKYHAYILVEIN